MEAYEEEVDVKEEDGGVWGGGGGGWTRRRRNRGGWRYKEEASYKEDGGGIRGWRWCTKRRMEADKEEEQTRRMEVQGDGREDGGTRKQAKRTGERMEVQESRQGGWRYKEVGKEDGGTRRWARRMEVEVGEEDGGMRRRRRPPTRR
jgi:hypothetical protein